MAVPLSCSSSSSKGDQNSGGSGGTGETGGTSGSTSEVGGAGVAGTGGSAGTAGGDTGGSGGEGGVDAGVLPPSYTTVELTQTSRNAGAAGVAEHCAALPALTPHAASAATNTSVVVDLTQPRQKLVGFGAAITEAVASTISILPTNQQQEIYDAYFSQTGSGYTLTRTHIGSCDFSLAEYSYDDTAGDTALTDFSIDHDQTYLIPALKKALSSSGGTLKILSSLWSAPAWMKSNASLYDGMLLPQNYAVFAQYLTQYVQAYHTAGLDIWGITPTNEPLGVGGSRESMVWDANTMNTFVRDNLGPAFQTAGLSTKIFIFDHNKDATTTDAVTWAQTMLGDTTTNPFVAGTAVHWYNSTFKVFEAELDTLHGVDPTKDILFDEGTADGFIFNANANQIHAAPWWQNDDWFWTKAEYDWGYIYATPTDMPDHPGYAPVYRYARDLIAGLNHWYVGWIDWNAVLNKYGAQDALGGGIGNFGDPGVSHIENGVPAGIMIDEADPNAATLYYTPIFYTMRQFSKFIQPDARIVTTTVTPAANVMAVDYDNTPTQDGQSLLAVGALNPDGSTAVVLFNETGNSIDYSLQVGDQAVDASIPAQSLQTLVWK